MFVSRVRRNHLQEYGFVRCQLDHEFETNDFGLGIKDSTTPPLPLRFTLFGSFKFSAEYPKTDKTSQLTPYVNQVRMPSIMKAQMELALHAPSTSNFLGALNLGSKCWQQHSDPLSSALLSPLADR